MGFHNVTRSSFRLARFLVFVPVFASSSQGVPRNADGQSSRESSLLTELAAPPEDTQQAVLDSLTVPSNVLVNPPSYTGRIVRNALYVRFRRDAPAAARAAAITRIHGEIIGGRRFNLADGLYLVRIPATVSKGDSSSGPLLRARKLLDSDPSVRGTLLLSLDALVAPTRVVPASAPDSVPDAVWIELQSSSNVLHNRAGTGGIIRDALLVAFKPGTNQSARQSAIDLIGGTVLGGVRIGYPERMYVVRIPYVLSSGDSVSGPVLRAVDTLRSLSAVDVAVVIPTDRLRAN